MAKFYKNRMGEYINLNTPDVIRVLGGTIRAEHLDRGVDGILALATFPTEEEAHAELESILDIHEAPQVAEPIVEQVEEPEADADLDDDGKVSKKELVYQRHSDGEAFETIAADLGIAVNTAKSYYRDMVHKLEEQQSDQQAEQPDQPEQHELLEQPEDVVQEDEPEEYMSREPQL